MQPSERCLAAIKQPSWEGCRLRIYPDLNGYPTIGRGHKLTHDDIVSGRYAKGITQEQADTLFDHDCIPVAAQVDALGLRLSQGKFDALFSFDYNLGINALKTMLHHGMNAVPFELPRWTFAGGRSEAGLVLRRLTELSWWQETA